MQRADLRVLVKPSACRVTVLDKNCAEIALSNRNSYDRLVVLFYWTNSRILTGLNAGEK